MWLGWANWFKARRATGSGVAFRPQLCNMYIALSAGSIMWNTGGSFKVHHRYATNEFARDLPIRGGFRGGL